MIEIIFNNVLPYIVIAIGFLLLFWFYIKNIQIVIYTKQKNNKVLKLSKLLHKYYNLFFIILFIISLLSFAGIYFLHSYKIEKRFDNALQSYEKSISNIFYNLSISTNNQTNENIVSSNETSSISVSTMDRISINNNNIMNMCEGDGFDLLKKSFEIGLDLLKASLSETMKDSNDVLTFWLGFLSVIMVVFSFAGYFINNNILEQSKTQLKMVKKEAEQSIKNIKIETQKLIDEYNKYIQISNLLNLGIQAANIQDYKLAEKYFSGVIELDKNNSIAYNNRGATRIFFGDLELAIKDFDKAIELNPYLSEAYNNRGNAKNNLGNTYNSIDYLESAIKDYNKAIEINANNSEAYNNRGSTKKDLANIYKNVNYLESAIKDFDKAIELNFNNSKAYYNRGNTKNDLANVHNNIDYLKEAIKDFDKAIKLNPYLSEAYNGRGNVKNSLANVYNNIDYLKEAIKDFDKAIEINANNSEVYFNRYISKSLLFKITDKDSEKYKKYFEDAYNDLDTAYNLADEQLKAMIKEKVISMAILGNEVVIKFCENKGWDIK